jgi:hypothetical protein
MLRALMLCSIPLVLAVAGLSGCKDTTGLPCAIDADCPDGQLCSQGHCTPIGGPDGGDEDGTTRPDRGDLGSWDAGSLPTCERTADCARGEVCFNGFCVTVDPDPNCQVGDADQCEDDSYCEQQLDGCVPWDAHPEPAWACEHIPPEGEFTPIEEWVWQNPVEAPEWDEVMMTPVVIDLTGQAAPEVYSVPAVVFHSFRADTGYSQDGVLRAVRGDTGEPIFSVTDPSLYTHPVSNIAAGDLDGDGLPEIVTGKSGGRDLICFNSDGTLRWMTETDSLVVGWGGPAIANVDGVGPPEIVMGAAVINADGTVRWHQAGASRGDNFRQNAAAPFSVPADVDGDGLMEIVTGDTLFAHDGQVIWDTGYGDGFVALAEFGSGGPPEIVVVSRGSVRSQSSATGEISFLKTELDLNTLPECSPNCGLLGPPTVADFDGDGKPEIGVAGADVYIVLDTYGTVLWSVATRDGSSNITGSAVFDFEGDRRAEVVYADEVSLKVLRGSDGQVLYEQPHSSLTACEYPVIADVDSDGNAEIVIAQNDLMEDAPVKFKGVRVFGDAADNWVNTRRIWNQHAYHVTNVEENGAIPVTAERNWLVAGLNNFRQNVQPQGVFNAPDLTARGLGFAAAGCPAAGIVLYAEVNNRGHQMVPPGVPVSFYLGDPRANGRLIGVAETRHPLTPGQGEVVAVLWEDPPLNTPLDIYVVADDDGGGPVPNGVHSECREANNTGLLPDVVCNPET